MALRELLAEFGIKTDLSALDAGEAKVDAFAANLASKLNAIENKKIKAPKLEEPVDLTKDAVLITIDLDIAEAQDKFNAIEQEIAATELTIMAGGDTSEAEAALIELQTQAQKTDAELQSMGDNIAASADKRLGSLETRLKKLGDIKTADPKALKAIKTEARLAEAQIKRLSKVDATNPSLTKLQGQLSKVKAGAAGVSKGTATATTATAGLGVSLGALAPILGGAALLSYGKGLIDAAALSTDLADQTGLSIASVQAWQVLLPVAGAQFEDLKDAVKTSSVAITESTKAGSAQAKMFKTLGLSGEELAKVPVEEAVLRIGGALSRMTNESERTALSQKLLGGQAARLLPVFKGGEKAARDQLEQFKENAAFTDEFANEADAFNDQLEISKALFAGAAANILKLLLPAFKFILDIFSKGAKALQKLNIASAGAFATFKLAPVILSKIVGMFARLFKGAGGVSNILKTGARFVIKFFLPFLVLDDIITFLQGGDSLLGRWIDKMLGVGAAAEVLDIVKELWGGLTGAIEIAWSALFGGEDAMANLSDSQKAGIESLSQAWGDFGTFFSDLWGGMGVTALQAIEGIKAALKELLSAIPLVGDTLGGLIGDFKKVEGKGIFDLAGFTGGDEFAEGRALRAAQQTARGVSVPKPAPPVPAQITNAPVVTNTFTNVGTPATAQQAGDTVVRGTIGALKVSNKQMAKAVGATI